MHKLRAAAHAVVSRFTWAGAPPLAQNSAPRAPLSFTFHSLGNESPRWEGRGGLGRGRAARGGRRKKTGGRTRLCLRAAFSTRAPCGKHREPFTGFLQHPTQQWRFDAGVALKASSVLIWKLSFQERHPMEFCSYATWIIKDFIRALKF